MTCCTMVVRNELRRITQEVKNELSNNDSATIKSALNRLLPLLTGQPHTTGDASISQLDFPESQLHIAQETFAEFEFSGLVDYILCKLSTEWVSEVNRDGGGRLMEMIFTQGPPMEAFLALSHHISNNRGYSLNKCVELTERWLLESGLLRALRRVCLGPSPHTADTCWQQVVTELVSLPDRVLAKQHRDAPSVFYPAQFVLRLCTDMMSVLRELRASLISDKDCAVSPLSQLLGKLCIVGHGGLVWSSLLPALLRELESEPGWRRLTETLVLQVPEHCREATVTALLTNLPWYGQVALFLGDSVLTNQRLQYLLTTKLLLHRHYPDNRLLWNIIGYLAYTTSLKPLFYQTVQAVLRVWGDVGAVKHSSYEHHHYLSRALLISLAFIKQDSCSEQHKQDLMRLLLPGLPPHLDSSVAQVRRLGMVVGECMTAELSPHALKFEYEKDSEVVALMELLTPPTNPTLATLPTDLAHISLTSGEEKMKPQTSEVIAHTEVTQGEGHSSSDLDSDDELEPCDMSADTKLSKVRPPLYLRQCMEGLISTDDPDRIEICVIHAESLIRANHRLLPEVAEEFCKVLLHLEDTVSVEDFTLRRHRAMVALLVHAPVQVAPYLTSQVYERNYSLRQRIDILQVMATAARELSEPPRRDLTVTSVADAVSDPQSWQAIVQQRIESKTRRFSRGPRPVDLPRGENRFAPVAGLFFFPLLSHFDKTDVSVDLCGDDHIVLSNLLSSLSVIVHAAIHAPIVRQMASSLLQFLWLFRYHSQSGVRRAVHGCVLMILVTVPSHVLVTDFQSDIYDLKEWLQGCVEGDSDDVCRSSAAQGLLLLHEALHKEFGQQEGS